MTGTVSSAIDTMAWIARVTSSGSQLFFMVAGRVDAPPSPPAGSAGVMPQCSVSVSRMSAYQAQLRPSASSSFRSRVPTSMREE